MKSPCVYPWGGVAGKVDTKKVPTPFFPVSPFFSCTIFVVAIRRMLPASLSNSCCPLLRACLPRGGGGGRVPVTLGVGCPAMGLARDQSRTLPAPLPGPPGPYLPLKVSCYPLTPTKP